MTEAWLSADDIATRLDVTNDTVYARLTGKGLPHTRGVAVRSSNLARSTTRSAAAVQWRGRIRSRLELSIRHAATDMNVSGYSYPGLLPKFERRTNDTGR